ncbi:MAG: glycosyltransferase family 4 protein [Nitrospiria bacterium]
MNILVLCFEYPPIGGGGGIGAKQYAEAWACKDHSVTVLTSWAPGLAFRETVNGVDIIRVSVVRRSDRATATFLSMLSYIISGFIYVLFHLGEFRHTEVANTHFAIPTGPLGFLVSRVLRIPNVLTIIGGDIYDPSKKSSPHRSAVLRLINTLLMNRADSVVAISSETKRRAGEYYNVRKEIRVINYGFVPVELPQRKGLYLQDEDGIYYLIAVGRLIERKGFEYLIESLKLLPARIRLVIIGDGPLESQLKDVVRRNDLTERVILAGYRSRDEVYGYLRDADCFVLSSLHEGLGIVVQEAMFAGLPIVCTDNGGQVDLVKNGRNGILIKPRDVTMLADAILKFYDNRDFASIVGWNNREDIGAYYIERNCEEYIDVLREAIKEFNECK